jgi:predicted NAD-dependent protein-ADP-ribosyltransferase YbiA (DUF1768 family)
MIVPGSNLLGIALTVIAPQQIVLYRFLSRTQNAIGEWVSTYAAGIPVEGSWQPVDQNKYESLGLDLSKKYYMFYTSEVIESIARGVSPDLAERNGRKYSTVADTPWNDVDGWQSAMFVDIGVAD